MASRCRTIPDSTVRRGQRRRKRFACINGAGKRSEASGSRSTGGEERGKLLAAYRRDMAAHCILMVDTRSVLWERHFAKKSMLLLKGWVVECVLQTGSGQTRLEAFQVPACEFRDAICMHHDPRASIDFTLAAVPVPQNPQGNNLLLSGAWTKDFGGQEQAESSQNHPYREQPLLRR